ncbi:tetratricopeptide repeat protein [Sphingomonas sp.]|uniref:tetratricopeptide repeat protein n=1 Tax=Sphingomonas sp. TaxID=28214 RepID=UPI002CE2EC07|nr:tetratricopeptide repeat protein [Sphingomonas sp.]HWK37241.1 tetratricopeptide repeat protein [Sphingomonas sp.]
MTAARPAWADVPQSLAAYVKARAADADGAVEAASLAYGQALAGSPGNPVIAIRAYREALAAGDMTLVRASIDTLQTAGVAPADATVIAVADAVAAGKWEAANAAADRMANGPLEFLAPVIKAWVAFDRGDADAARMLADSGKGGLSRRFNAENRALLLIAGGKVDEGIAQIRVLLGAGGGNLDLRVNAAMLLAHAGRADVARALTAGDDRVLAALREQLGDGAAPGARFGVSRLFTRLAADLVRGEARPLSIVLGRAAMLLDPRDERARLILADGLSADGAERRAIALLDEVQPTSIYYATVLGAKVTVLNRAGQRDRALATAGEIAAAPGAGAQDLQRYGDLLVAAGRFDDAAAAYASAMKRAKDGPGWILYLQRGGALEQGGRWREAEAMLEQAVKLAPDEAVALNYLGYARLTRGENLASAQAMLERAAKLEPDDSAIADSLGWAYVQTGQIDKAMPLLERAARAEPADVTIQEHLGDAYWRSGRRYEARYAWRAASVHAEADDAARLSAKLAAGLK